MIHLGFYCLAALLTLAAVAAELPISGSVGVGVAGLAICLIGVPHGGLDHWRGRRWLQPLVGPLWAPIFFSGYLLVGCAVVAGWTWLPVLTVLGFFTISAWHFGREDQHAWQTSVLPSANESRTTRSSTAGLQQHLAAIALGGIAIWVPAIVRPTEMQGILSALISQENAAATFNIVRITTFAASLLLPCAIWFALRQWRQPERRTVIIAAVATGLIAAVAPILHSFTIYFCGWHSIRGLQRLRREEQLSWRELAWRAAPMSLGAVVLMLAIAFSIEQPLAKLAASGLEQQKIGLKMLFVGLSAIAVPHLLLHELGDSDNAYKLSTEVGS